MNLNFEQELEQMYSDIVDESIRLNKPKPQSIDIPTAKYLSQFIKEYKPARILEIGTNLGFSSIWFADALSSYSKPNKQIDTVESSKKYYKSAIKNSEKYKMDGYINNLNDHAPKCLSGLPLDQYDMVFIDCIKLYYIDIIKILEKNIKIGTIIIADNIISHSEQLQEYIDYASNNQFETMLKEVGTGLLISKYSP